MKGKSLIIGLLVVGVVTLLAVWIARNTYWDEIKIPSPLRNEAARNPFYGAQHIVESLGGTSTWDRIQRDVSPDAVIVVSSWHWDLAAGRRTRMERWVESGGRLVLDRTLVGGQEEFERWSGISRRLPQRPAGQSEEEEDEAAGSPPGKRRECRMLEETMAGDAEASAGMFELCAPEDRTQLVTTRPVAWALRDDWGNQVLRVKVGKGSVTMINAVPFRFRQILQGDHAALLVAAAQLHRGDDVHFLSEEDHPSMLTLMWLLGWPVVLLVLALIFLALWRNSVRFGPSVAEPDVARRSLAEQIRGTGQFVLRFGGGKALHAAAVRSLNEAARRRIAVYTRLPAADRIEALARLTGMEASTLGPAIHHEGRRRPHELRQALALIEAARRRLLNERKD